jgi:hypothetical protein
MAVINTPVGGRLRMTFMGNVPDTSINGVSPTATAIQALSLVQAINDLQTGTVDQGFVIVESDLTNV